MLKVKATNKNMGTKQSFFKVSIESYNLNQQAVFYNVQISTVEQDSKAWSIQKRFSHFYNFRQQLTKKFPNIPKMPSKTVTKVINNTKIEQRKAHLEQFLRECVKREDIMTSQEAIQFFELDKNAQQLVQQAPSCTEVLRDLTFPIVDFQFIENQNLLILGSTDMAEGSRFYSRIINTKMPWSDKNNHRISAPISEVKIYHLAQQEENTLELLSTMQSNQIFRIFFKKMLYSIDFNQQASLLSIGLDDGYILIFALKIQQSPQEQINEQPLFNIDSQINYEKQLIINPHEKAVTGISVSVEKEFIVTCSKDKFLQIIDLTKGNTLSQIQIDEDGLTNMQVDWDKCKAFVASEGGVLAIVDVSTKIANIVSRISVVNESMITQINLDTLQNYIFTSQRAQSSSVYEIKTEKEPQKLVEYVGRTDNTAICWNRIGQDVYVGDVSGNITVWGLSDIPKYVWRAHNQQIQKIQYLSKIKSILTASCDKTLKLWTLPQTWLPQQWHQFLQNQNQGKQVIGGKLVQQEIIQQYKLQLDQHVTQEVKEEEKMPWMK